MRTQRIKTGFHRIGAVAAGICAIPVIGAFAFSAYMLATGAMNDAGIGAALGGAWLATGAALYALSRALGWIIAGFAGDGSQNSK
jgi:hypothetical protein